MTSMAPPPRSGTVRSDSRDSDRAALVAALAAAGRGDRNALKTIYDLTHAKLFGICLRICNEQAAAEDVLQNVYLKVWQRAGRFDPDRASPISWLATIARNAAIDWRRSLKPDDPLPDDIGERIADSSMDAHDRVEAKQEQARIFACMRGLEDERRHAIRAAFYQGLSYPEIASAMGRPLGTIKSWVRRGLLQLKECLERE